MSASLQTGKLVSLRGRNWVVLPSNIPELLKVKPLGGSDEETTGIYLPLEIPEDIPQDTRFPPPVPEDLGDISTAPLSLRFRTFGLPQWRRAFPGPRQALVSSSCLPDSYLW